MNIQKEVMEIISRTLGVPIQPDSAPNTTPQWDSLNYVNVVVAIEKRFKVSFSNAELEHLNSVPNIVARLSEKLASPQKS